MSSSALDCAYTQPREPEGVNDLIGSYLDKYEVLRKVGEGGMATVYQGRHVTLDREVAIKVLHPHLSASTRNRKRFAREARAIEHLNHKNILKIYDYSGVDVPDCYIVTEYVEGHTLLKLIDDRGLLPSEVVALMGVRLAEALAYAHTSGIIHRDIKPENIMLRYDGLVKLMDFGIARFLDESTVTMTGALVGSPAYMSPEQALEKPVDARSDLFALGTVLFHLVTGQLPYSGSNPSVILRNIIEGARPEVLELQPGMSPRLADVIERLLQIDPDNRFGAAAEVKAALMEVLEESEISIAAPEWALVRFLADPADYEVRLREHLDLVLLDKGREAFARGDHLVAQRLLNRLLVQDPEHAEVLELLSGVHNPDLPERRRGLVPVALGGLALVVGAGVLWLVLRPAETDTPTPVAVEVFESAQTSGAPTGALDLGESEVQLVATPPQPERPTVATPPARIIPPGGMLPRPDPRPRATNRALTPLPPEQSETPPAEATQARVVIRITGGTWGAAVLDGESIGIVRQPLKRELTPGRHELKLLNPYAQEYITHFDVSAGQTRQIVVTLVKLPLTVTFRQSVADDCLVRLNDRLLGQVGANGRSFDIQKNPEATHTISLQCSDKPQQQFTVKEQPGSTVLLPPGP